jgi:hypothetical protein
MTHRFLLFSEEQANFVMEIMALPSTTFHELHTLIMDSCGYSESGNHLFLICNEEWKVKQKIHLNDVASMDYDEDIFLMESSILEDFIEEEGQHMAYIYEPSTKKKFLIELVENIFGEKAEKAFIRRQKGTVPTQFNEEPIIPTQPEASPATTSTDEQASEDAYTDDSFNEDEIDMEGFEVTEM